MSDLIWSSEAQMRRIKPHLQFSHGMRRVIDEAGQPIIDPAVGKKTPQQGAGTVVFAATSPLLDGVGGVYLKDNDISPLDDGDRQLTADCIPAEIASHYIDPQDAGRLWVMSELMIGRSIC